MKINESNFAFICFRLFAFIFAELAPWLYRQLFRLEAGPWLIYWRLLAFVGLLLAFIWPHGLAATAAAPWRDPGAPDRRGCWRWPPERWRARGRPRAGDRDDCARRSRASGT